MKVINEHKTKAMKPQQNVNNKVQNVQ